MKKTIIAGCITVAGILTSWVTGTSAFQESWFGALPGVGWLLIAVVEWASALVLRGRRLGTFSPAVAVLGGFLGLGLGYLFLSVIGLFLGLMQTHLTTSLGLLVVVCLGLGPLFLGVRWGIRCTSDREIPWWRLAAR